MLGPQLQRGDADEDAGGSVSQIGIVLSVLQRRSVARLSGVFLPCGLADRLIGRGVEGGHPPQDCESFSPGVDGGVERKEGGGP